MPPLARGAELSSSTGASDSERPAEPDRAGRPAAIARHADLVLMALALACAFEVWLAMRVGVVGRFNDDTTYALGARALAMSHQYSLPVFPGSPLAPRFPVGFPLLLSLFWSATGPAVVGVWEIVVATLALAFFMLAYVLLTRVWGVSRPAGALAVLLMAAHPLTVKYASCVMSDLPYACFGLVALAAVEGTRRSDPSRPWSGALSLGGAALALAWAILLRYAGLAALGAGALTLWLDGKRKEAVGLCALTAALLSPWIAWVSAHRASGYVTEIERGGVGPLAFVWRGMHWLAVQSLPGLLAPWPFLGGLAAGPGTFKPTGAPIDGIGLVVTAGMIAAAISAAMPLRTRLPALYCLLTVALVGGWSGAFPTMGWGLEVRLLLPAAPLLLAFAFELVGRQAPSLSPGRKAVVVVACAGIVAWAAWVDVQADSYQHARSRSLAFQARGLVAAGAYLAHIPATVKVGAPFPLLAAFYAPRPYWPVDITPAALERARSEGAKLVFAQPFYIQAQDYTFKAIDDLVKRHLAQVLYVASPHVAIVRILPAAGRLTTRRTGLVLSNGPRAAGARRD